MSGQGVGLCGHTVCSSPAYSIFPVKSSQNLDFLMYFSMLLKSSDLLPLLMQTQQKGTVPLVDSVTERQQSYESPTKPLDFARKSELSLMEKKPKSFRTVCIPRWTSAKWVPAFFCSKHSKTDPFSRFSVLFSLFRTFPPFI